MDIKEKAKTELENRVQKVERFIEERGVGSSYLARAKRTQRNINLAIVIGGIITVTGLTFWALSNSSKEEG